jgi:hypothetical protein
MPDIGASAIMGIAPEVTPGTYVAPAKFFPFESETLNYTQDTTWRRPIRNTPGLVGAILGNAHTEGDINMELLTDVVVYFMKASRCTLVKAGAGPYTYTYTPAPLAVPVNTVSISVKRGQEVFGYTGCILAGFTMTVDSSGALKFNPKIVGGDEATAAALSGVTWPASVPFGVGQYSVQVPTATQIFDADNFEFTTDEGAEPQYRLKSSGRGASFVKFGESSATAKLDRDFSTRAEYDAFKALTAQSISFLATQGASYSVLVTMPVAYKDAYDIKIGGQGDLVRASVSFQGAINAGGAHWTMVVTELTSIT